jgi:tRNA-Thr(GGU) m(6)t(6)A37 methyltransferase TsaA
LKLELVMTERFEVFPVGFVKRRGEDVSILVLDDYRDALLGLDGFSHILVLSWFHKNDTAEKRHKLQVHPRADPANPLSGVFATRSPVRPNPIAVFTCRLLSIEGNTLHIDKIDAFDGTPVIDIKPCISEYDMAVDLRVPEWVHRKGSERG